MGAGGLAISGARAGAPLPGESRIAVSAESECGGVPAAIGVDRRGGAKVPGAEGLFIFSRSANGDMEREMKRRDASSVESEELASASTKRDVDLSGSHSKTHGGHSSRRLEGYPTVDTDKQPMSGREMWGSKNLNESSAGTNEARGWRFNHDRGRNHVGLKSLTNFTLHLPYAHRLRTGLWPQRDHNYTIARIGVIRIL